MTVKPYAAISNSQTFLLRNKFFSSANGISGAFASALFFGLWCGRKSHRINTIKSRGALERIRALRRDRITLCILYRINAATHKTRHLSTSFNKHLNATNWRFLVVSKRKLAFFPSLFIVLVNHSIITHFEIGLVKCGFVTLFSELSISLCIM